MRKNTILNVYSWLIIVIGTFILGNAIVHVVQIPPSHLGDIIVFTLLVVITESLSIEVAGGSAVSTSFAINFCSILVFSPYIAILIAYTGKLLSFYKQDDKICHIFNTSFYKRLFNTSVSALSVFAAASVYNLIGRQIPYFNITTINFMGAISSVLAYILLNIFSYSILFSIIEEKPVLETMASFGWIIKNFNMLAPFGILMALSYETWNVLVILLFLGPFLLARYTYAMYVDMKNLYYKTINTLTHAIDAKDKYTNGHSHRVALYAECTAKKLSLPSKQVELIKRSAILHDIGKIGISDTIINKPSHLDVVERSTIQTHPIIGEEIIKEIDAFYDVSRIIRHHHEHYNGMGYPDKLSADQIPFESAIIAVADSYDAMTSDRAYRLALSHDTAIDIIRDERGKQFHPKVVDAFIEAIKEKICY